jgi:radical SAM superfamily enzyme YgiQ (UPF0313 family)
VKVLLIYPKYPDTYWSFRHALPFIGKKAAFPPLGLLTVAALLPRKWEMRLIDLNIVQLLDSDLEWADYVFTGAMTVQRDSVREIINRCSNCGVKTVAGGPLFTTSPDDFPAVTHLVLGEAEITLPLFLKDLEAGNPRHIYLSKDRPDIAHTPPPRWDLIDSRLYAAMNLQFSRGCPFDCEFCDITQLFGRNTRTKTSQQVITELDALYSRGWRGGIFFVDDNFIGDKLKLKEELLPEMISWMNKHNHPYFFYTEVSINLADDPLLMQMMVDAGFKEVFIGIESPEDEAHQEAGKIQNRNRDLAASVRRIHGAGLQVQGGFIVGFDSDSTTIFEKQLRFIQESGIVTAMVGMLTVLRGTKLHARLLKEGRVLSSSTGNNTALALNYTPKMNPQDLVEGYKNLMSSIYSPENFYKRIKTFLRDYRISGPSPCGRLHRRDVMAFFKSIYFLGILGKERVQYWQVFLWTILRKPRMLPLTITLSIYGFHFRKVTEKMTADSQALAGEPSAVSPE